MAHNHSHATTSNSKRLAIALGLTLTFLIAEVIGGIVFNSLALLSDAAHMGTDVMALIIAIMAIKIGSRPADLQRTFGYRRFEILAAAVNAAVLILIAFYILYEAWQRFQDPPEVASTGMLIVAGIGLAVNLISMRILSGGKDSSLNMRAAYMEVFADMLGSFGVILAALVIQFTGWWYADPILAVLIGFWVLPRTWKLLGESVNILLEGVPLGFEMKKLHDELVAIPGVREVHDLHVWAVTSGVNSLSAHLLVENFPTDNSMLSAAQTIAKKYEVQHTNFQIEVENCGPGGACSLDATGQEHHGHDHKEAHS